MVVDSIDYTIPQIFEKIEAAETKNAKKQVLIDYKYNKAFKEILRGAFDKKIMWIDIDDIKWTADDAPLGLNPSHLGWEMKFEKITRFRIENAHKTNLSKTEELFKDMMSSLHPSEANVIVNMFKKNLKVKGLDRNLIREVFPNLLG